MPTYINPRRVDVEPRGGNPVAAVIILAVIGYATWQVAEWLASAAAAIIACVAVLCAAGTVLIARELRYRTWRPAASESGRERLSASVIGSSAAIADRPATAISARSPRAIEAPAVVHYHLHVEGVPDRELARVLRRVQPGIGEDQC